eukprot:TRINITY_DN6105_c0_g1_i1.p1 TRINITY_DN6105_c0_g1~~TRINITY_DN6105_c0_g1_i1.p1  ORF type:complete len:263 (-),score=74.89 TRINITY_DN6105_c0_g1_i1:152-940(-)
MFRRPCKPEYAKAVDDCLVAVELDPTSVKAWYRGAKACEAMGLLKRAQRMCGEAAKLRPDDADIKRFGQQLVRLIAKREKEKAAEAEREKARIARQQEERGKVTAAIKEAEVELCPPIYSAAQYYSTEKGSPFPRLDAEGDLEWPLLFVYDETSQSDFVQHFSVLVPPDNMLKEMFPGETFPGWDKERKYVWKDLVVYLEAYEDTAPKDAEAEESQFLVVDVQRPLLEVMMHRRIPEVLVLHTFVKGSACHKGWCQVHGLTC